MGKEWIEVGRFPLVSGRRNCISMQLKDGETRLDVNRKSIARKLLPAAVAESSELFWIGNWATGLAVTVRSTDGLKKY